MHCVKRQTTEQMPHVVRTVLVHGRAPTGVRKFFVYLLRCSDGSIYAGYTVDLQSRLARHNSGRGSKYVASRLPVKLEYVEERPDLGSAMRRELELKRMSRAEKLRLCATQKGVLRRSLR